MSKSIFLSFFLAFTVFIGFSQSGYTIIENRENANVTEFNKNLEKCNFDLYRMYNQNRILRFDNGISIALTSAKEIIDKGGFIKVTTLTKDDQPVEHPILFHIDSNGNVLQRHENTDIKTIKTNEQQNQR